MPPVQDALRALYHNPADPGSLGGVERLYRRAHELHVPGANREAVKDYLRGEQAYTLHKPARRHYVRNHTYVGGIDRQWQADLADMQQYARQNGGMRYLLTVIDVFSKFAWVEPVRSKDAGTVTGAFQQVLERARPRRPRRLQTDKGKEFFNGTFRNLMREKHIQHFASESDQKAAVAERFNRTIKTRLWTYLSDRGTVRWIDIIQDLVRSYNNSYHRSIGMKPVDMRQQDQDRVWVRLYGDGDTHLKPPIPIGSMVRVSNAKGIFEKGYLPNWTKEHFNVSAHPRKRLGTKRRVYKLRDYNNDAIRGSWYPEEVQQIRDNQYRIERVIRRRTAADGTQELLVKWDGWPAKFNSWINENDRYDVVQQ